MRTLRGTLHGGRRCSSGCTLVRRTRCAGRVAPAGAPALDVDGGRRRAGPPVGRRAGARRHPAGRRARRRAHRRPARRHRAPVRRRLRRPVRPRRDRADGAGARPRLRRATGASTPARGASGRRRGRRHRGRSPGPSTPPGAPPPASPTRCWAASRSTRTPGRHGGCRLRFAPTARCWSAPATTPSAATRRTATPWAARCCASTRDR